jgi:hypothetical protein
MKKYTSDRGIEFTKLKGKALKLAKKYNEFSKKKTQEQHDLSVEYEKHMLRLQAEDIAKRTEILTKILIELELDASPEKHMMYELFSVYGMFDFAVLVKDTNMDVDETPKAVH